MVEINTTFKFEDREEIKNKGRKFYEKNLKILEVLFKPIYLSISYLIGKIISFFTGSSSKSTSIVLSFSMPCVVSVLIFFKNSFLKAMIS